MIKQHKIRDFGSANAAIQSALKIEGVPASVARRCYVNGAMPGDGVAKGSIAFPANGQGGMTSYSRIYKWPELESILNGKEERQRFASWVRGSWERYQTALHPISRATWEMPSTDGQGVLKWRWWIFNAAEMLELFYRPQDKPHYMARSTLPTGEHIATEYFRDADSALGYLQDHGIRLRGYKPQLPVMFRWEGGKVNGSAVAVFPTLPADMDGREVTIYAHVGQHGGASWAWFHSTRHKPAKPEQYAELMEELRGIYGESHGEGDPVYELVPVRKRTTAHREAFDLALRQIKRGSARYERTRKEKESA
jgi:hypothetical protein